VPNASASGSPDFDLAARLAPARASVAAQFTASLARPTCVAYTGGAEPETFFEGRPTMAALGPVGRTPGRAPAESAAPSAEPPCPQSQDTEAPATAARDDRFVTTPQRNNPFDSAIESGLRSARSSLLDAGTETAMKQIDAAAAEVPAWNPATRNLLKEDLRLKLDTQLPGAETAGPPGPPAAEGWTFSPIVRPAPHLSLDPGRGPVDGLGMRAGIEARSSELRLHAQVDANLDQPLRDPRLSSVGGEVGFDFGRQGAFVAGDRLSVSGKAGITQTYGTSATTTSFATQLGATYMARGVLAPGDALSITAGATFRNDDLAGARGPQYGVNSSLIYQF
jgi:hypothetical protein